MHTPTLADLPPPPPGRIGWPWTEASPPLPPTRPDGSAWPRITIVTPSFNQGEFIEETIRSVLLQGYPNLEYIVMDGGSTDGAVHIIRKYAEWIDYWESERDRGQAHAINKGLRVATGDFFQNINSDDVLLPNALALVGGVAANVDLVQGDVVEFTPEGATWLVSNRAISVANLLRPYWRTAKVSWHQPGVFLRRERLIELGGYDETLHYLFDLHITARYVERFPSHANLLAPLVRFRIHRNAKSSTLSEVYAEESIRVRDLLGDALLSAANRKFAALEADRRRLVHAISGLAWATDRQGQARRALRIVVHRPRLCSDHMFLGSIRRMPRLWFTALITR